MARVEGEGAGVRWWGCALLVRGLKVGALGEEVLQADEIGVMASRGRMHESRLAVLRRRGGGATRGERWRRGAGQQGRRAATVEGEGAGGGWWGGAYLVCGLKLSAVGDEVLEAAELAVVVLAAPQDAISREHEGRPAVLRRRGGGATRGERRR